MARGSLMVVSSAVLDKVVLPGAGPLERPGGPALYAGAAARLEGWRAYAVGPWSPLVLEAVLAERLLGVERPCCGMPRGGSVYLLDYTGPGGRRAAALHVGPALGPVEVLGWHRSLEPDVVLYSPVHREAPPWLAALLRGASIVILDAQGPARAGLGYALPRGAADAVHGGPEELSRVAPGAAPIVVETNGYGPIRVYQEGRLLATIPRPPGPRLPDPTGAGDAFSALLGIALARGMGPAEAALWASGRVHLALGLLRDILGGRPRGLGGGVG